VFKVAATNLNLPLSVSTASDCSNNPTDNNYLHQITNNTARSSLEGTPLPLLPCSKFFNTKKKTITKIENRP